jgi:dTDP-glucose 4,6-dehydratase/UDP-glucuronate decarboxylase
VAQLAHLIIESARQLFDYRGRVVVGDAQEADYLVDNPNRRCPVIDKARAELGYSPQVLVGDGIYRSLVWYSHNRSGSIS